MFTSERLGDSVWPCKCWSVSLGPVCQGGGMSSQLLLTRIPQFSDPAVSSNPLKIDSKRRWITILGTISLMVAL